MNPRRAHKAMPCHDVTLVCEAFYCQGKGKEKLKIDL